MSQLPTTGTSSSEHVSAPTPKWCPLEPLGRRILGVLVEKAKTTPDNYPLSVNAIVTGCNQKNNRDPFMDVDEDEVEIQLDKLRGLGAVAEVHGSGRVVKYRHYMKEWLAVDGVELAVMTELLLRGAQSVGDLRGRAARMAPGQIADVSALRPILDGLIAKKLVLEMTPPGRGQYVSHALYQPDELPYVKARVAKWVTAEANQNPSPSPAHTAAPSSTTPMRTPPAPLPNSQVDDLRKEVEQLKSDVARLKQEVADIWSNIR